MVVVSGTSEFDTTLLAQAQKEFRSYEKRVSFTYLSELSLQQLLATLARLPPRDVVLFLSMFQDEPANSSFHMKSSNVFPARPACRSTVSSINTLVAGS